MRVAIAIAAVVAPIPTLQAPAQATVYHVASTLGASDANPGTAGQPWATIQHAVDAPEVGPGDVIFVHGGGYPGARITRSGLAGQPITLTGDPASVVQVLGGGPHNALHSALEVEGVGTPAGWWVIQHLQFHGYSWPDVHSAVVLRNTEHIVLRADLFRSTQKNGVFATHSEDLVVEDSEFFQNCDYGLQVTGGSDRPTIRRNLFRWNGTNSISGLDTAHVLLGGGAAEGGDGVISDAVVEGNRFFGVAAPIGCDNGVGLQLDGVVDAVIRNNLMWHLNNDGIVATRLDGAVCSQGNRVLNNTILVAGFGGWAYRQTDDGGSPAGCPDNLVVDNILWTDDPSTGAISLDEPSPTGFDSRHNLVEGVFSTDGGATSATFAQWQALGYGSGSQEIADAAALAGLFADAAGDDYHLAPGSDAIDAGELRPEVTSDLDGHPRPLGVTQDVGAYEFGFAPDVFADGFESGDTGGWSEVVPP